MSEEFRTCRTCPENGPQPIDKFGPYESRGKILRRKQCNVCRSKEGMRKYREDPERRLRAYWRSRKSILKNRYNTTENDFQKLLEVQNGKCKICSRKPKTLNIDHDHKTGKIRGLLCWECNVGLGHFQDNIEFLLNAVSYLKGE